MDQPSNPQTDVAAGAGHLAKSAGQLSLALSLLAARQVTSLVAPTTKADASGLDDVARAAGNQLSGATRTVHAVGTNVQSGIVDAAFDFAGFGARGQAPSGDTSGLAIPTFARAMRRVAALRTMASGTLSRPVPQSELVGRLTLYLSDSGPRFRVLDEQAMERERLLRERFQPSDDSVAARLVSLPAMLVGTAMLTLPSALSRPIGRLWDSFAGHVPDGRAPADAPAGDQFEPERAVAGLWKSEGLSTSVGKYFTPENTLADAALPANVLPVAHVGFGSGSTQALMFDVDRLNARLESACHPTFRGFAYEGIGATLRLYERGFFKVMSGALGLIALDSPDGPDPTDFFAAYLAQYPADIQRLIAHGYGRIVAFSNLDIYSAIEQATAFPEERIEPAVQGCGFAFACMNSFDLPRILENSAIPFSPGVRTAFQSGLIYSLVYFDWYAPGMLEAWKPKGTLEADLVAHARREAESSRQRGHLLPFLLQNPRT